MSIEKSRILAELIKLRRNRHHQAWLLGGTAALSLLSVVTSFAYPVLSSNDTVAIQTDVEQLGRPASAIEPVDDFVFAGEERVRPGDTVSSLIRRLGIDDPKADAFFRTDAVARTIQSRLRSGQIVGVRFDSEGHFQGLSYPLQGFDREIVVERKGGELLAKESTLKLDVRTDARTGVIRSSLFAAADEIGLPDAVAVQLAEIFAGEIDFHTDLRRDDRFSVLYESFSHDGREVRTGRVLAAEFVNAGVRHRAVWYDGGGISAGYFTPDGQSLKKAFLRSPLEFSRVSSGFSMRLHPILGDWRAHKGVDYAAPLGTNVRATADGQVEFIGHQRGYGNFIVLRHHARYTTAYGHLNGFAPGLRQGSRVSQGDLIGYVGRTGWATGPHLHYEFRIAEVHQNPLSIALPVAEPLTVAQLDAFHALAQPMLMRFEMLNGVKSASTD